MIHDLLHADRVLRLMAIGLTYPQACRCSKADAELLIEAAEIAAEGMDEDGGVHIYVGGQPDA